MAETQGKLSILGYQALSVCVCVCVYGWVGVCVCVSVQHIYNKISDFENLYLTTIYLK